MLREQRAVWRYSDQSAIRGAGSVPQLASARQIMGVAGLDWASYEPLSRHLIERLVTQ